MDGHIVQSFSLESLAVESPPIADLSVGTDGSWLALGIAGALRVAEGVVHEFPGGQGGTGLAVYDVAASQGGAWIAGRLTDGLSETDGARDRWGVTFMDTDGQTGSYASFPESVSLAVSDREVWAWTNAGDQTGRIWPLRRTADDKIVTGSAIKVDGPIRDVAPYGRGVVLLVAGTPTQLLKLVN